MTSRSHIYFASDLHLGAPDKASSLEREKAFVRWLDRIEPHAKALYLLGDLFDFWFEYKKVVPKGYNRLLGKLALMSDNGLDLHLFTGNHDMWIFDHIPEELGATLHRDPIVREFNGRSFYMGHGDGLGPGDKGYKILKKVFGNRICQKLFSWVHPGLGVRIAEYWSHTSRNATEQEEDGFLGEEKEWLVQYCLSVLEKEHHDFFLFGHRHLPIDHPLPAGKGSSTPSRYLNLGDWLQYRSYAVFNGEELRLEYFRE